MYVIQLVNLFHPYYRRYCL